MISHPNQPQMQVEVILASKGPYQKPLATMRARYPRIIHGEVLTHRMFSRNARSSRAVPVQTMLNEVRSIPFVPWHWGKNQKGMQAGEECNTSIYRTDFENDQMELSREEAWLHARDAAVEVAEAFMNSGYHKQVINRLIEPFSWIDTLITATEWDNFLWLRDHKDAEPHLQDLARLVRQAIADAEIHEIQPGDWHTPYINQDDRAYATNHFLDHNLGGIKAGWNWLNKISAARCARISYKPFDGDASYERELERYDMLVTSDRVHASPLEHQAMPDRWIEMIANRHEPTQEWAEPELHGNLPGWVQARKLIPNEVYT